MVVSDFHVFIRDVLQHVDAVQKDHPGLPVFLLGHSMVCRPRRGPRSSAPSVHPAGDGGGRPLPSQRGPSAHAACGAPGGCLLRKQGGVGILRRPQRRASPPTPPLQGPRVTLLPLFGVGPLGSCFLPVSESRGSH